MQMRAKVIYHLVQYSLGTCELCCRLHFRLFDLGGVLLYSGPSEHSVVRENYSEMTTTLTAAVREDTRQSAGPRQNIEPRNV